MPTFITPEPITTRLTVAGAQVRVVAGDRLDTVVRVEPVNSANKLDLKVAEGTKVDFAAGELSIKTTKSGDKNGSVAITIELPIGSKLALSLAWTDVRAEGPLGDCELEMASGQVQLDHIAALRAQLAAGEVAIGHIAGTATIETASAGIRLGEVDGAVRYQGANGKVWIGHAHSDIDLSGASGGFDIGRADGSVTAKGAGCPIRVRRLTHGQAELENYSGGIEIGISEGTVAWVDAKSTKGSVHSSLPTRDEPGEFDNKLKIYARAKFDDIVIHRATN
jgi:DUF4097 and DUF4098 domain-containing protein YvlB